MSTTCVIFDSSSPLDPASLPDDPAVLKQLLLELLKMLRRETKRREQVERNLDLLLRKLRACHRPAACEGQQVLFDTTGDSEPAPEAGAAPATEAAASDESAAPSPGKRPPKHTPHGRRRPPQNVEEREEVHDLTDPIKEQLGGADNLIPLPDVITFQYDYQAAKFIVIKHVQKKYLRRDLANGAASPEAGDSEPTTSEPAVSEPAANESATEHAAENGDLLSSGCAADAAKETGPAADEIPEQPRGGDAAVGETLAGETTPVDETPRVAAIGETPAAPAPSFGKIVVAPKPAAALPGCLAAPGLLAFIWLSKYADHLPLYRQERITERYGVRFSRSCTSGWMMSLADALRPLYQSAIQEVIASLVIHTDDTRVQMQDPQTREFRTARFWNYVGDEEHPLTVFDFTLSRERDGPAAFLKDFRGYLQADAYSGYDGIYLNSGGRIVEVACWQHARAKYKESAPSDPLRSTAALAFIKGLYKVEEEVRKECEGPWKELTLPERAAQIAALRQAKSSPVLDSFRQWLDRITNSVLPKSPLGEAIRYTLNQWDALRRYTQCGRLSIDNNVSERAHRGIAIGRKNWLFVGSQRGGEAAAVHFTLIASCLRNRVDPFAYLVDVLTRLPDTRPDDLPNLLPHRWRPSATPQAPSAS